MVKKLNEVAEIDEDMIAKVDLTKAAVYVVCDGIIEPVDPPPTGYGEQEISWREGKPTYTKISYTKQHGR